jgi:hypothetical protein
MVENIPLDAAYFPQMLEFPRLVCSGFDRLILLIANFLIEYCQIIDIFPASAGTQHCCVPTAKIGN